MYLKNQFFVIYEFFVIHNFSDNSDLPYQFINYHMLPRPII